MSIKNIVSGWTNYIKAKSPLGLSEDLQKLSLHRSEICKSCPSLSDTPLKVAGKTVARAQCIECGCAFPQLVYAPDKQCPLGKWSTQGPS